MSKKILSLCCLGLLASGFSIAHADTISFTGTGTNTGGALDAMATITTGAGGSLQIILSNLESNTGNAAQELSGIIVTLSNTVTTQGKTQVPVGDFSGNLITIASGGGVTPVTTDSTTFYHWGDSASGSAICLATVAQGAATCGEGGQPADLIIGPAPYTGVNSSVINFNPQIQQTGTFNLNFSGITANTSVTGVTFFFGTGTDDGPSIPGVRAITPEPPALLLLGTGIVGLAGALRYRMKAAKQAS